jgi:hypothetical protein
MKTKFFRCLALACLLDTCAGAASAQGLEELGPRAPAMAAFVAVADDASAVHWNPSGLVFGPIFNITIDLGRSTSQTDPAPRFPAAAGRGQNMFIAFGLPPVGVSYTRISSVAVVTRSPAAVGTEDREEEQVLLRAVVTSALGATVLQSVGDYITVGATLKVVRGGEGRAIGQVESWSEAFDHADRLERPEKTTVDADLGGMVSVGRIRAGVVLRNVGEPDFEAADGRALVVRRHARVGVAWGDRWPGQARTIVAADADVTRVFAVDGERRDVAIGAERWLRGSQLSVRAGLRVSTVGESRPNVSGGASFAVRAGTYLDGFVGAGRDRTRFWGLGIRVTY